MQGKFVHFRLLAYFPVQIFGTFRQPFLSLQKTKCHENYYFADDYTKEVLYMLKKSNVDVSSTDLAYRGIQIAFASIQYSESMTYTSVNAE